MKNGSSEGPTQDQPVQASEGTQELTPEEVMQWTAENMMADVVAFLGMHTNCTEEERLKVAGLVVNEQFQIIQQVLPTLTEPAALKSHPTLVLKVASPNGVQGNVAAPKLLNGINDPGIAIHTAFIHALLLAPGVRALLRVHGFQYAFAQSADSTGHKKIII